MQTWLDLLSHAEVAINSASIANTEFSPFYLNFGYHPTFYCDQKEPRYPPHGAQFEPLRQFLSRLTTTWETVRVALQKQQVKAAAMANRKRADYQFHVGDQVLVNRSKRFKRRLSGNRGPLAPKAIGPFPIKRQITRNTFVLDLPHAVRGRSLPVFHSSELIPFVSRVLDPVGLLPPGFGPSERHRELL